MLELDVLRQLLASMYGMNFIDDSGKPVVPGPAVILSVISSSDLLARPWQAGYAARILLVLGHLA